MSFFLNVDSPQIMDRSNRLVPSTVPCNSIICGVDSCTQSSDDLQNVLFSAGQDEISPSPVFYVQS